MGHPEHSPLAKVLKSRHPPLKPKGGLPNNNFIFKRLLGGGVVGEGGVGGDEEEFAKVALAEAADFVAKGGGALEFEFLGGLAHLRFELLDDTAEIVLGADDVGLEIVGGNGEVVGFDDARRAPCRRTLMMDCGVMLCSML